MPTGKGRSSSYRLVAANQNEGLATIDDAIDVVREVTNHFRDCERFRHESLLHDLIIRLHEREPESQRISGVYAERLCGWYPLHLLVIPGNLMQ